MTEEYVLSELQVRIIEYVIEYGGLKGARLCETGEKAPPGSGVIYLDEDFLQWGIPPEWEYLGLDEDTLISKMRELEKLGYLHAQEDVTRFDSNEYHVNWSATDKGKKAIDKA